ncbi:MAG: PRC and DUF2382 domain-containing protein [Solirubrobacterales bacterium]|nr:PRC and DUF2382 domain-containing protein [Solirubrobacterales bacterium]
MSETTDVYDFRERTLIGSDGEKIGTIDELYNDDQTGRPEWALVNTGLFGTKKTFVPISGASPNGENLQVQVTKAQVKDAPRVDPDQELSEAEERELFTHYGVPYTSEGSTTATGGAGDAAAGAGSETGVGAGQRGAGHDVSGPTTDDAMTRSEEELRVGTAQRERGRVRLRKYVVTEHVQQTVPVKREEVRLEREPITDANVEQAVSGPEISEEEHEVVLHEEEPVVEKRVVPKERVRLGTETQHGEQEISEEVRKEQIEMEDGERR